MPHPDMVAKDARGRAYLIQGQTNQFLCLDHQQHSNAGAAAVLQCHGYQVSSSGGTYASAPLFTGAYRETGLFHSIGLIQRPMTQEQELEVLWQEISTGSFTRGNNLEKRQAPVSDRTGMLQLLDSSHRNPWMNSPFCPASMMYSNGFQEQDAALTNSAVSGPSIPAGLLSQSYFAADHNITSSNTGCCTSPGPEIHSFMQNEELGGSIEDEHEHLPNVIEDSLHMPCALVDNVPDEPLQHDTSLIWGMQSLSQSQAQSEQVQPSQSSQTPFSFAGTHAAGSGSTSPHLGTSQYASSGTFAALSSPCLLQDSLPASCYSTPVETSVGNSSITKLSALTTPFSQAVADLGGPETSPVDHHSPPNSAPVVTTSASPLDLTSGPLSENAARAIRKPTKLDVTAISETYPDLAQAKVQRSCEYASPRSHMRMRSPRFKTEDGSPVQSSNNLVGLSSRESSQTLPEWSGRYGAGLRCSSGECSKPLEPPCDEHRCSCCKSGRKAVAYERQGYCGPCGKREIISGLRYVRCGKCKAEMVERAYEAHLKQFVMMVDPVTGKKSPIRCRDFVTSHPRVNLGIADGKRCSKCSNMRPMSYYSSESGTCNWHLPQRHASRLARMTSCDDALSAYNSCDLHLLSPAGADAMAHITTHPHQAKDSVDIADSGRMASSFL